MAAAALLRSDLPATSPSVVPLGSGNGGRGPGTKVLNPGYSRPLSGRSGAGCGWFPSARESEDGALGTMAESGRARGGAVEDEGGVRDLGEASPASGTGSWSACNTATTGAFAVVPTGADRRAAQTATNSKTVAADPSQRQSHSHWRAGLGAGFSSARAIVASCWRQRAHCEKCSS